MYRVSRSRWVYVIVALAILSLSYPVMAVSETWIPTDATAYDGGATDVTSRVNQSDGVLYSLADSENITVHGWNGTVEAGEVLPSVMIYVEIDFTHPNAYTYIYTNVTGSHSQCGSCMTAVGFTGLYSCNLTGNCSVDTGSELNGLEVQAYMIGVSVSYDHIYLDVTRPPDIAPPEAPVLVSPDNGSLINTDTPYLDWTEPYDRTGIDVYQLQVSNSTGFEAGNLTLDRDDISDSDYTVTAPESLDDSIYHWRVRANDTEGNGFGSWSGAYTLTVDTIYPVLTVNSPFNTTYPSTTIAFNVTAIDINLDTCWYDLDSVGYIHLPYAGYGDDYYGENSTMTQGSHQVYFMCNDTADNQNISATVHFSVDTLPPAMPVNLLPYDTDHTNVNQTNFTWTQPYDQTSVDAYQLQVSNSTGFEAGNITTDIDSIYDLYNALTAVDELGDGLYHWHVRANDTLGNGYGSWSAYYNVTIDTVYPDWTLGSYPAYDNSTVVADSVTWDASVNDANLYRILLNVTDQYDAVKHSNYTDDWNTTIFSFGHVIDTSGWDDGDYTVELSATDDHTYGDLCGLTYDIQIDGINFCKGAVCKKIYFGYYSGGEYHVLTPAQVTNFNVTAGIYDTGNGEYVFNMEFDRPATDVLFGFAIPKSLMTVRDTGTGHFIWRDWYIDFEDLLGTGFPITYIETVQYHVIYTSTAYCDVAVGERCKLE
ncbi:hypothetical protein GQ472_02010 [archaeon]|nr:hypothetical protein [archaeon]